MGPPPLALTQVGLVLLWVGLPPTPTPPHRWAWKTHLPSGPGAWSLCVAVAPPSSLGAPPCWGSCILGDHRPASPKLLSCPRVWPELGCRADRCGHHPLTLPRNVSSDALFQRRFQPDGG